ncbi:AcrR family transcriptional regulator [Paraburkholderia sp. GAS199]|uniref:TetR/AcrR family transcriptional regulator n=1 Tax=Paraburkholderia sp. GAS199 TaxID=3035126 RepID=UPI003D1FCB47
MKKTTPPPRLSREESRSQTRASLLAAAKQLFVERGFGATSLRDIATAAGYTQGAFYSNFADKEALFLELMQERAKMEVGEIAEVFRDPATSAEDVLAALEGWARTLDTDPEWSVLGIEFELLASRNAEFAEASQALWNAHRDGLAICIAQLFARFGRVPPEAPTTLAASFMALAHGLAMQRTVVENVPVGHMTMVFLRGLLASADKAR